MMSWPYSPRIRMRPLGPGAPMRRLGSPRLSLAGGQSDRSGTCPSRVWITVRPTARAVVQHLLERGDDGLQVADVVAERLAEAARLDEVALHVDDHQRGGGGVERERVRLGGNGGHERFSQVVASMTDVESDTQPNTPPCMVTMCSAAAWLPGSVAPVQSDRIRHS